jgi:hypothetical protein
MYSYEYTKTQNSKHLSKNRAWDKPLSKLQPGVNRSNSKATKQLPRAVICSEALTQARYYQDFTTILRRISPRICRGFY